MKTAIGYMIALVALIFSIFDDLPETIATSVFGSTELIDESHGYFSLYELLANRNDLTGQRVFISGVLSFVDEEQYPTLFVNLESAQEPILQNGIPIWSYNDHCQMDLTPYREKYVTMWAQLSKDGRALHNVDSINLNSPLESSPQTYVICSRRKQEQLQQ